MLAFLLSDQTIKTRGRNKDGPQSGTGFLQVICLTANAGGQGVITRQSVMISLRAALLLLPLYGLHYLVIVYRPNIE